MVSHTMSSIRPMSTFNTSAIFNFKMSPAFFTRHQVPSSISSNVRRQSDISVCHFLGYHPFMRFLRFPQLEHASSPTMRLSATIHVYEHLLFPFDPMVSTYFSNTSGFIYLYEASRTCLCLASVSEFPARPKQQSENQRSIRSFQLFPLYRFETRLSASSSTDSLYIFKWRSTIYPFEPTYYFLRIIPL